MNENLTIINADCLTGLKQVPAASVQCCVTSPPYWGLRSYLPKGHPLKALEIGTEKTPEEYVAKIVAVMAEVWRVLKPDGTLWLNLGDSYAGGGNGGGGSYANDGPRMLRMTGTDKNVPGRTGDRGCVSGLKPKDLVGIPWRVALALQAAGWYLRSDIIWAKANCMPESVTDRPTRSHEYIFLLSKSAKYFYDHEAIKEPCIYDVDGTGTAARKARASADLKSHPSAERSGIRPPSVPAQRDVASIGEAKPDNIRNELESADVELSQRDNSHLKNGGYKNSVNFEGKNQRDAGLKYGVQAQPAKQRGHSRRHDGFNARWDVMEKAEQCQGMRNKRDVWTIAPANYPEAHFATFPTALIVPCIRAGSRPGDTVLDPFGGSGTTAEVAIAEGRKAIVCELNEAYIPLIQQRTNVTPGLNFKTS